MPHGEAEPERLFGGWRSLLVAALLTCVLALRAPRTEVVAGPFCNFATGRSVSQRAHAPNYGTRAYR
jgi:hypothetical protein